MNNMFNFKTLLVERTFDCPTCGRQLTIGNVMYEDVDRGDRLCGYCEEDYKDNVVSVEGEDGSLLK